MLKIRLTRRGRIHRPFYAIVVADIRCPRDGRFKEKIGTYDPLAQLRHVTMKSDRLLFWLFKGAQPTKTVRDLCAAAGLLLVKHLIEGLQRSCIDKKVAHHRLSAWQKIVDQRKKPRIRFESSISLASLLDNVEAHGATRSTSNTLNKKNKSKAQA